MNTINTEVVHINVPGFGQAITWLPVIPDDAPYPVREGVARQRIAATGGRCPCGAQTDYTADVADGINVAEVRHRRLCPGHPDQLAVELRRWVR